MARIRDQQTRGLFHHYLRTTPRLDVAGTLKFGSATLRRWTEQEAEVLADRLRRRTVFARHSAERDLYAEKAKALAMATVMEIVFPDNHDLVADDIRAAGDLHERLLFLVDTWARKRPAIHRALGVSVHSHGHEAIDLLAAANLSHVSTQMKRTTSRQGVAIDATKTARRAKRLGLDAAIVSNLWRTRCETAGRIRSALEWLEQSKLEARHDAAIVKTAIGLETLFVFNGSEPPRRAVSERLAYLLGETASERMALSRALSKFSDLRSAVVHGGRRRNLPVSILDHVDRLLLLACLGIAGQMASSQTTEKLRSWFESLRWGAVSLPPQIPSSRALVRQALRSLQGKPNRSPK